MNYLIIAVLSLTSMLFSCGSSNKLDSPSAEKTQGNTDASYKIGKVHIDSDGCRVFIITEGENSEKLYPVGLDDMFKVNNAILQFEYDYSRAPLPEGCQGSRAVVLRNVTRVKR